MTTEEQDQIHGRLLRQRGEIRRRLAGLAAKLSEAASTFAIEALPDKTALLAILQEFTEERRALRDIEVQLERFDSE